MYKNSAEVNVWDDPILCFTSAYPDGKIHGANLGPIWGRQDPAGPHVGPMNFAIWVGISMIYVFL